MKSPKNDNLKSPIQRTIHLDGSLGTWIWQYERMVHLPGLVLARISRHHVGGFQSKKTWGKHTTLIFEVSSPMDKIKKKNNGWGWLSWLSKRGRCFHCRPFLNQNFHTFFHEHPASNFICRRTLPACTARMGLGGRLDVVTTVNCAPHGFGVGWGRNFGSQNRKIQASYLTTLLFFKGFFGDFLVFYILATMSSSI